jgi:hypothetical protein
MREKEMMTQRYERCRLSICVCVGGIYLSDGGDYMGDGRLNRKAERAVFILNTRQHGRDNKPLVVQ